MIDSYGDRPNPCTFCVGEGDIVSANDKEYLEFSLCGNDTSLFVREVSVEDLTKPKKHELSTEEVGRSESPEPTKTSGRMTTVSSVKSHKRSSPTSKSCNNQRLDALYTKKWSGNTYFEEECRRLREQQYENDVRQAMKMRKLWHSFQKELLKDRRRDLVKSSGPEWWQEPSTKQIVLATTLRDVIKADYEEGVVGRTRQWLIDLGVATRLTPRQVRKCMNRSLLEPVDFLLETHSLIVKSQINVKKKGTLQTPFSVDERLLLTAVCVLQLPTLLTMLHYMLPPPKPLPVDKRKHELLYGNLDDETIRYSTPYMEPLPFRNKIDFEDWAFGKICRALLPMLLQGDHAAADVKKSLLSEKITSDLKSSLSLESPSPPQNNRSSVYSTAPSIALLLSYCLSKRKITGSLKVHVDNESVNRRKTFGRRLSLLGKFQSQPKPIELSTNEQSGNPGQTSFKSLETEPIPSPRENTQTAIKKEIVTPPTQEYRPYEEYTWTNQPWQGDPNQMMTSENVYPYSAPLYYEDNMYDQQVDYYDNTGINKPSKEGPKTISRMKTVDTSSSKMTVEEGHSEMRASMKSFHQEEEANGSLHQLVDVWEEIAACPEKEQLLKAMKVLTEMGDPLAQLPKIEKLPTIQRWLELRRGKNRLLSKETKKKLLNRSRGMWKSVHFSSLTKGPKVDITKSEERKLTWDRKKWLESEVRKESEKYFSKIKQEKVDNARVFFPTMLNHYDHGSKLNRNFRDIYYTYLPGREADTFVYRPWQPQETRNSKT